MNLRTAAASIGLGVVAAVAAVAVMVGTGLAPVKTETRTVVQQTGTSNVALTTSGLTPEQIYGKYSKGVVEVMSTFEAASTMTPFGPTGPQSAQALGTGFVVSKDGYILTNAHVVNDNGQTAKSVSVAFKGTGSDSTATTKVDAKIVGVDNTSDVALLKVDPGKTGDLTVLPLGDSSELQVGEPVVAIGNPLGYDFSLTTGVVSALDRELQSPNGSVISNGIQTDAAINSGNSGGPLIDSSGHVIGINEQIASQSGGNQGLGFAVPINTAVRVMDQLKSGGQVKYAWLGIQGQTLTSDVASALGIKGEGVLVAQAVDGSPAAKAGIKGGSEQKTIQGQTYVVGGDVITAVDGQQLSSMDELAGIVSQHSPGDKVKLTVLRDGKTLEVTATLGEKPQQY
jgi:putative serine protease PepD